MSNNAACDKCGYYGIRFNSNYTCINCSSPVTIESDEDYRSEEHDTEEEVKDDDSSPEDRED